MFDVKPHKAFIRELHKIASNYSVLFNDGDNDVLYSGLNVFSNRILGAIIYDNDELAQLGYFHILLTELQYYSFINKKASLRSLLESNEGFFVVRKNYRGEEISADLVKLEDIPIEFLPLSNSFCPDFILHPTFEYGVSLKGLLADAHLTTVNALNNVSTHVSSFIESATSFVNDLAMKRNLYVEALPAGSFRINFKIEVEPLHKDSLFQVPSEDLRAFFASYFHYLFETLPEEESSIFKQEKISSPGFDALEEKLSEIYSAAGALPSAGVEQKLIDSMCYAIENLKDITYGESFEHLEFINLKRSGEEVPLGAIDQSYFPLVSEKFFAKEKKEDIIVFDDFPTNYDILVYSLNKETGNGSAYLIVNNAVQKIALHLRGKDNYQNTIFTRNMDETEPKQMTIKAIAKKINGKIVNLTYTFNP